MTRPSQEDCDCVFATQLQNCEDCVFARRRLEVGVLRRLRLRSPRKDGTADTLLDAASYGSRWVLLSPAPAAGVARALGPRAP